jgi:hypothetical protein
MNPRADTTKPARAGYPIIRECSVNKGIVHNVIAELPVALSAAKDLSQP